MTNRPKQIGTEFESGFVRYMRSATGDMRIRRSALAGSADVGDIEGLCSRGLNGIAECKSHKKISPSLVEKWQSETLRERGNAGADFAVLVVHVPGRDSTGRSRSFGLNKVRITIEDYIKLLVDDGMDTMSSDEFCHRWIEMDVDNFIWFAYQRGADGHEL